MALGFTSQEISRKYDRIARWYDWVEGVPDLLGVSRLRRQLLRGAWGSVLEIAVGTGKNLRLYPRDCRIFLIQNGIPCAEESCFAHQIRFECISLYKLKQFQISQSRHTTERISSVTVAVKERSHLLGWT